MGTLVLKEVLASEGRKGAGAVEKAKEAAKDAEGNSKKKVAAIMKKTKTQAQGILKKAQKKSANLKKRAAAVKKASASKAKKVITDARSKAKKDASKITK